jgi:Xaa-Pro aminopeptidase
MGFGRVGVETPTLTPIDRRLVEVGILTAEEREQLNAYHARVLAEVGPLAEA